MKDKTIKQVVKEFKNFKKIFKSKKCNCGNGIVINMVYIGEQDLETLLVRIIKHLEYPYARKLDYRKFRQGEKFP